MSRRLVKRFRGHAVSPEHAAEKILDGVQRDRYAIFTSRDIQVTHWLQRKWELPYVLAMRAVNRILLAGLDETAPPAPPAPPVSVHER